jgi:uncharacterized protein (DUF427 family)
VTLSGGRAPLSPDRIGRFTRPVPDDLAYVEPYHRRLRGQVGGRTVIDSERVLLIHRPAWPWYVVAFPPEDVDDSVPSKPDPDAPGYVRVRWDAIETWMEEDQLVVGHLKNPYHRVDCLRSSRRIEVRVSDTVLVDTDRTVLLLETSLVPRLYVAKDDVRMDLLSPSETTTYCSYKGVASYWNATVDGTVVPDVAWSYEQPLPTSGCDAIRGRLSFTLDAPGLVVTAALPPGGTIV